MTNKQLLIGLLVLAITMTGYSNAYANVTTSGAMISATAVSNGDIDLIWGASVSDSTFVDYKVKRSTTSGFDPLTSGTTICTETNVSVLSCTDSSGVDGTTYYYRLITTDDDETVIADTPNEVSATSDSSLPVVTGSTTNIVSGGNTELTSTDQYTESGTATDNDPLNPTVTVQSGGIDTSVLGLQSVTYQATDNAGNIGTDTVSTTVVDTTAPTFNLVTSGITQGGSFTTNIVKNVGTYTADTFENQADISGILSSVIGGDTVDTSTVGTYTVTYTVTDNNGNSSVVTETVNVTSGDTPVITLTGTSPVSVEVTSVYADAGATASDTEDGDITSSIVTGGLPIDTSSVGTFTVTYDVTDSSGNSAVQVTRTVNVIDTTVPVITLTGTSPVSVVVGGTYTDAGATASDVADGDITSSIVTGGLPIDTSSVGTFTVTYDVTDSQGNSAVQVTRTVNVVLGDAPVLTINGNDQSLPFGGSFTVPTSTCIDTEDGDISSSVIVTNNVNSQSSGSYTVDYSCTDSSGNTVTDFITVTVGTKPNGSSANKHLTAPTSGTSWDGVHNQLVKNGITVNNKKFDITDNWWTPFERQYLKTSSTNTFSVKTYAQNNGLLVQELAFGIPRVGDYNNAEVLVEVWYNYDKTIKQVKVIQDTDVIDESTLSVTTNQVSCDGGERQCYQTNFVILFNEPLKDDVFAVKAIDMSRRTMSPTYLNDGVNVSGENLNPLPTRNIIGTEKYEGLITVTQMEKYSNLWIADDGRIFEFFGDSDSYRLTNPTYEMTPTPRVSDSLKNWTVKNAVSVFDSSELQSELPDSFTYEYPETDSRTQFLLDHDMIGFTRGS